MKKLTKRIICGIRWRIQTVFRMIFPHKVIKIVDHGEDNVVMVDGNPNGEGLRIVFNGSHNRVEIGARCCFFRQNCIFVAGDGNIVTIGARTTFDGNVLLVPGEGTSINIGEDCMFAEGVTIRTTDQHPIYASDGTRLNPAKSIKIGSHVWLGAKCVIMKGIAIGGGTMVGYGGLVTKTLPEKCLAVGTPARVFKDNITWCRTFSQKPKLND